MGVRTILSVSVFEELRSALETMTGSVQNRIHAVPSSEHQRIAVDHVYAICRFFGFGFQLCVCASDNFNIVSEKEI